MESQVKGNEERLKYNERQHRKKQIVWHDPAVSARDVAATSGLDYLNGIKECKIHPPPIAMLVRYKIVEVHHGFAVFELNPEECHYNPFSTVHGGIPSTLLDTTMTASILSTLPASKSCTTVEIKVNFIRPVTEQNGILRCKAKPIHIGGSLATAQGRLRDYKENLCAHGVCTFSIFKLDAKKVNHDEKQYR